MRTAFGISYAYLAAYLIQTQELKSCWVILVIVAVYEDECAATSKLMAGFSRLKSSFSVRFFKQKIA